MATLLGRMDRLQKVTDRGVLLAAARATARVRTTARLAATSTGVAGGLAAAVTSVAGGLAAAVASVTSRLAAAVAGVAGWLAAAAVLPLALLEQSLQATEQVMLAALPSATARRTAAAITSTGVAGRLAAAVAGIATGLATTITSTGIAARLTARGAALAAEHPIEELETEGLATNGHAENQRTEEQHTLHRATSPLLVDHCGVRPARDAVTRGCDPRTFFLRQACRAIP